MIDSKNLNSIKNNIVELTEYSLYLLVTEKRSFRSVAKETNTPQTTLFIRIAKLSIERLKQVHLKIALLEQSCTSLSKNLADEITKGRALE